MQSNQELEQYLNSLSSTEYGMIANRDLDDKAWVLANPKIDFIEAPLLNDSSSAIRKSIEQANKLTEINDLTKEVKLYIESQELYRSQ